MTENKSKSLDNSILPIGVTMLLNSQFGVTNKPPYYAKKKEQTITTRFWISRSRLSLLPLLCFCIRVFPLSGVQLQSRIHSMLVVP